MKFISSYAGLLTWILYTSLCEPNSLYFQLLAATLQVEKPELEVRRTELLRQEEDLKVQLVNLEDHLLTTLAESQGNILENKVHFLGIIP